MNISGGNENAELWLPGEFSQRIASRRKHEGQRQRCKKAGDVKICNPMHAGLRVRAE
jgi:hypothetical protein